MSNPKPVQTRVVQAAFLVEMLFFLVYLAMPDLLVESWILGVAVLGVVILSLAITGRYSIRWIRYQMSTEAEPA